MTYRDYAVGLAQRLPNNFVGVVFYRSMGSVAAKWDVVGFPRAADLIGWYEEIAGAPTLYYYVAALDKHYDRSPVADAIAPPQPGEDGYVAFDAARRLGYRWKPGAFPPTYRTRAGVAVGAETRLVTHREPTWYPITLIAAMFGVAYAATSRATAKIKRERDKHSRSR